MVDRLAIYVAGRPRNIGFQHEYVFSFSFIALVVIKRNRENTRKKIDSVS